MTRTIDGALQVIKEEDPHTAITRWAIRQAVINGDIPSRKTGRKYLVTVEAVKRHFGASEK